jgi:ornithine cyclodeaminase/alanine dehydrogenase-like protein (mu-crystallin family)
MKEAVHRMRSVFESLADGSGLNQPRRRLILPTGSVLHSMAGAWGPYFGTKYYGTNARHGAHFFFTLFDAITARPVAMMQANFLGQIRTGAVSGFATSVMAKPDACTVGMIGSGFQAQTQLDAVAAVRNLKSVRVWSRSEEKRKAFALDCHVRLNLPVEATQTAEEAVRDADIVITATNAKEPVIEPAWVAHDAHVNAAGSNAATRRELPTGLVLKAACIAADSIEQARIEAGDLLLAFPTPEWPNVVELHSLLQGWHRSATGVTIFKSIGLGIEDVAAGAYVYEQAVQLGLGGSMPASYS